MVLNAFARILWFQMLLAHVFAQAHSYKQDQQHALDVEIELWKEHNSVTLHMDAPQHASAVQDLLQLVEFV